MHHLASQDITPPLPGRSPLSLFLSSFTSGYALDAIREWCLYALSTIWEWSLYALGVIWEWCLYALRAIQE